MENPVQSFGDTAKSLARNPLGIIALFIVLVYGFACVVTTTVSWSPTERLPLIYFLVIFPVLVLSVFGWLVSQHSRSLFAPSDFRDEQNYVKMQLAVVASLTAAAAKTEQASTQELQRIVESARSVGPASAVSGDGWRKQVLWVDDRPDNNIYERQAFEAVGLQFTLVESTQEAIQKLSSNRFAAIISDMGRREGPTEGYVLLDRLRQDGNSTPFFIYASSNAPQHKRETAQHGGQGNTSNPQELFEMVVKAVLGPGYD
jgi:CheY-like chemotaxis protein